MSNLRLRFLLAFVVAALVPMIVVGLWAREKIREDTEQDHARQLAATVEAARRRIEERAERDRHAVRRLCERDFVIDRLMLDLAVERFGPQKQEELVSLLPPMMRSLGLDTLAIVHAGGPGAARAQVLGAAHFPGRAGARDTDLLAAAKRAGEEPFVRDVRVRREGETRDARALLVACETERDEVDLAIVGGRFLEDDMGETLLGDVAPVQLVMAGPRGDVPPDVPAGGGRETVYVFEDASGDPAARLVAVIDNGPLLERLAALDRGFMIGAGSAFGGALLLGALLVLGLTRPLRELETAARRVGEGDLESTIDVRHGGEVGRALDAFNQMTHELKATRERLLRAERIAAWRDIARRIAHEVKNPLSPIQVSIETMRKTYAKGHPDFEEIFEESTQTILEEVERLKRIVSEFSQFARLPRPKPAPLDVTDVLEHVIGLHRGGGVDVTLDTGDDVPVVRADKEQLTQVLVNLVQNAADAAKAVHGQRGGLVEVEVDTDERTGGVEIVVRDNGPGIPPEERKNIFEPYYTTKAGGTGLGLAIVHRIIDDHGGTIEVEDAEGGGAASSSGAQLRIVLRPEGPPPEIEASLTDQSAVPLVQRRE